MHKERGKHGLDQHLIGSIIWYSCSCMASCRKKHAFVQPSEPGSLAHQNNAASCKTTDHLLQLASRIRQRHEPVGIDSRRIDPNNSLACSHSRLLPFLDSWKRACLERRPNSVHPFRQQLPSWVTKPCGNLSSCLRWIYNISTGSIHTSSNSKQAPKRNKSMRSMLAKLHGGELLTPGKRWVAHFCFRRYISAAITATGVLVISVACSASSSTPLPFQGAKLRADTIVVLTLHMDDHSS